MPKGSSFERKVCKQLSKWWTGGERDDVFWRSSQSGGRATQRAKKGIRTYGSYGDIAAVDPIGEPLLKLFTIELKRGSSHSHPGDLLDFKEDNIRHRWIKALIQTIRSRVQAGSPGWMMICRRDHRRAVVFIDRDTALDLDCFAKFLGRPPVFRFDLSLDGMAAHPGTRVRFVALPLDSFLARVSPKQIIQCVSTMK